MSLVKLSTLLFLFAFSTLPILAFGQSWDKQDYSGYRCAILQIKDVRVDEQRIRFSCSLANTGREALHFQPESHKNVIVFTADRSLEAAGLINEQGLIARALMSSGFSLKPGELINLKKFDFSRTIPAAPQEETPVPDESAAVDQVMMPNIPMGNTGEAKDDFVPLIDPDREGCPDLVIDSMWIVEERKNSMRVAIRMCNRGDGPAPLYTADRADKGMGVSFYFGTTDRISRGSRFIHGVHIDDGLASSEGRLLPGASLVKEVKVDTRKHTRFLTALQCRLDTFQRIHECDEANNEFVYYLR